MHPNMAAATGTYMEKDSDEPDLRPDVPITLVMNGGHTVHYKVPQEIAAELHDRVGDYASFVDFQDEETRQRVTINPGCLASVTTAADEVGWVMLIDKDPAEVRSLQIGHKTATLADAEPTDEEGFLTRVTELGLDSRPPARLRAAAATLAEKGIKFAVRYQD